MALTFDDGLAELHEHAFPTLRRFGLPAVVFVVAQVTLAVVLLVGAGLLIRTLRNLAAVERSGVTIETVRGSLPQVWIDENLGKWMHDYFEHDRVLVLDRADRVIYSHEDGTPHCGCDRHRS